MLKSPSQLETNTYKDVAIMLKTLKLTPAAIRDAILSIDDACLSAEELIAISKQLPTTEEVCIML